MKIEEQVSNLELSMKLKELGVKQKSLFYWINDITDEYKDEDRYSGEVKLKRHSEDVSLCSNERIKEIEFNYAGLNWSKYFKGQVVKIASAFTVAELGEMLPHYIPADVDERMSPYHFRCGRDKINDTRRWILYYIQNSNVGSGRILGNEFLVKEESEANARALMLIWLIKNKKVKP